ncbi:hypothetical protein H9657_15995 [Cellulomonas sp. Sa3CUA2]|uniref:Uncharacterized protein n=1 Tax=Cellulomonas avistercoris TaxID=2762242 RepID=A0ABR8QH70_9CELL|nr:hypothetical protein [Cellulomonas avistercoris]MBD7919774.1 hypothetical protein [Cellulomonas avistercoris]
MRSSSEAWWRRAPESRGTWVRLAVLLLLVGLLLLPPAVELTGALLTGTTQTTTVVSTVPEFAEGDAAGG